MFSLPPQEDCHTEKLISAMEERKGQTHKAKDCILDSRGDLWLHTIQHHDSGMQFPSRSFLVCSRTVSRHSPVLSDMISKRKNDTPSATDDEGSIDGNAITSSWAILLPEVLSTPLHWLLQLMHGYLPPKDAYGTTLAARYTIAALADEYDCVQLLQFHAQTWVSEMGIPNLSEATDILRAMCLAYNLDATGAYREALGRVATEFAPNCEELQTGLSAIILPSGTKEKIEYTRLRLMSMILEVVQDCLDILYDENPNESNFCRIHYQATDDKKSELLDCHARMLGSMVRNLAGKKLWPLPKPSDIVETSIRDLETIIIRLGDVCKAGKSNQVIMTAHTMCTVVFRRIDSHPISIRTREGRHDDLAPTDGPCQHEGRT